MAHIGEEAALARDAAIACVARLDQSLLLRLALGNLARHRHDIGGLALDRTRRAAADFRPHIMTILVPEPRFGDTGAAIIGCLHQAPPAPHSLVRMGQGGQRQANDLLRQPPDQCQRCGTGETDAAVRRMPRDQVHRIVGQEAIHGRAFGGGGIGGTLTILRRGRDQHGLNQGRQHGTDINLPNRQGEPGCRQQSRRLNNGDGQQGRSSRDPGANHGGAAAHKGGFRRHQREPHHQGRCHPARQ